MRKTVKNIILGIICLLFLVPITGCESTSDKNTSLKNDTTTKEDIKNVELNVGDSYKVSDESSLVTSEKWKSSTSDDSVADISSNRDIRAIGAGTATVKIDDGNNITEYKITVKDNQNRRFNKEKYQNNNDVTGYLGAGYNVLKVSGVEAKNYNTSTTILDLSKIGNELNSDGTKKFITLSEDEASTELLYITAESLDSFKERSAETISGGLDVSFKKMISGKADAKFEKSSNINSETKQSYTSLSLLINKYRLSLSLQAKAMKEYMHNGVWESLTGENGTKVEDFIDKYGTHIVTSYYLGGRLNYDYLLYSNSKSISKKDLLDVAGNLKLSFSAVTGQAEASVSENEESDSLSSDYTLTTKYSTLGGPTISVNPNDSKNFPKTLEAWASVFADSEKVDNYLAVVDFPNGGALLPVWDLLKDASSDKEEQEKYNKRIQEFIDYVNNKITDAKVDINEKTENVEKTTSGFKSWISRVFKR